jgi:uncharacterized protein (DUF433 family)
MSGQDRISADPETCHGAPCIRGTRVLVTVILDNLAAGASRAEIVKAYPGLEDDDVLAAIAYAAELARTRQAPRKPGAA